MGSAQSLFAGEHDGEVAQLAARLGPHPIDRVAQAAALVRTMPYFDDLAGRGVALPAVDPADVATLAPLTDLIDTLACDTLPDAALPAAALPAGDDEVVPRMRRPVRTVTVAFPSPESRGYALTVTQGNRALGGGASFGGAGAGGAASLGGATWGARTWRFAAPLDLEDIQGAYLVLVGVAPTPCLVKRVPWGLVPGFLDAAAQLQRATAAADPLAIALPPNVVALALTHALLRGATLSVD
jgi:hypothetical protein